MATPTPPAPAAAPVRLRLVFYNRRLLRRAQREDGLLRCWLLLRPELATVADLAAHVAARFRILRSCPRGVVLSMDGFALPPFESTCIFRDKDIISVKQKACKKIVQHNDVHCIQDPEIVEKRPLPVDDEILAIEYQKDDSKHQEEVQCDHQCEENATANRKIENEDISSKRKWRDGDAGVPENSKRKKLKVANPGKHIGCSKEDNVHQDTDWCGSKMLKPSSSIDIEAKKVAIQAEATVTLEEEQKSERNNQTELNCDTEVAGRNAQSDSKKVESRSARRKRLKQQLRQKAKEQLKEGLSGRNSVHAVDLRTTGQSCWIGGQQEIKLFRKTSHNPYEIFRSKLCSCLKLHFLPSLP